MKKFDIPAFYRSPVISKIKEKRKDLDKLKKDFSPTKIRFGALNIYIARHFGFCYGVENAIEIVYRTLVGYPDKKIYLLSEMIHNPHVNEDLLNQGISFIQDSNGKQRIAWDEISKNDIVVIPAFGTTIEIEKILAEKEIEVKKYDTTCPFVERVWKRSAKLGQDNCTIIIHGKRYHEETRATFSHSKENAPALVIQDLDEAKLLASFIKGEKPMSLFFECFNDRFSSEFDPERDLQYLGVVNQTTMLATETQAISDYLRNIMLEKYGSENINQHFADTRDTLCYATSDNQAAVYGLLQEKADFAIVVGGYNSSNTSHLVELCEEKLPTYHISSAKELLNRETIQHFKFRTKELVQTPDYLPKEVTVLLTSGASCPDAMVEEVITKLMEFYQIPADVDMEEYII